MNEIDTNQIASDLTESGSLVKTNLSPGRVVHRKKVSSRNQHSQRASFPQARKLSSESKLAHNYEAKLNKTLSHDDEGTDSSTDRLEGTFLHFLSSR